MQAAASHMSTSAIGERDDGTPVPVTAAPNPQTRKSVFHAQAPLLIDSLIDGPDYLILVGANWEIVEANDAFRNAVALFTEGTSRSFLDFLAQGSREEVLSIQSERGLDRERVELCIPVRAGTLCVSCFFRHADEGWIIVGRDQSTQLELVQQMSVLVEGLEVRISEEKANAQTFKVLANRDPLTGIPNRRHFDELFSKQSSQYRRDGRHFAVISIDIDHFKSVNDMHGHPTGDKVLQRVARVLEESIRGGDTLARVGGEEFLLLAIGTQIPAVIDVAERLRVAVERARMPESVRGLTISLGVSSTTPDDPGLARDLIAIADRALYQAKTSGRNCVRWVE
jgi:diguanylate cyclase (GGDEF)-like protein